MVHKTINLILNEEAKKLVEKGNAKFVSYGYDDKFFLIQNDKIYAHKEKKYILMEKAIMPKYQSKHKYNIDDK